MVVHHDYSTRFGDTDLPTRRRRRVAARPSDFGPYPRRWVEAVEQQYDELWVWTRWSATPRAAAAWPTAGPRRTARRRHRAFTPGPAHPLTDDARCTFLFVGAAIERKGIDLLFPAYLGPSTATTT